MEHLCQMPQVLGEFAKNCGLGSVVLGRTFHSLTGSQIPGFVELWNRWIDSAGVSFTVTQIHKVQCLWNCEAVEHMRLPAKYWLLDC